MRKLLHVGPLKASAKIPSALWRSFVPDLSGPLETLQRRYLPGWSVETVLVAPERLVLIVETEDAG